MTNLNKKIRQEILEAVVTHAYESKLKELAKENAELAEAVRVALFGQHYAAAHRLPQSMLSSAPSLSFGGPNIKVSLHFSGDFTPMQFDGSPAFWKPGKCPSKDFRPVPIGSHTGWGLTIFPATFPKTADRDGLLKKWQFHSDKVSDFYKERAKRVQSIEAILKSVRTEKQLYETWPEIKTTAAPVIAKAAGKPNPQLPVPTLDALNADLGLPA
jgi:hypothetical protein